ncbi:MAG: DUF4859 domain-containing protein [Prevotella sp.]|nr:DUF4859 domain-containing protein [Prevotella sp.]
MKKILVSLLLIISAFSHAVAEKTVYIPSTWSYNAATQEYTEGGNSDLQWSFNRSKQTDNCIIFWQKGFGSDPGSAPSINGTDMTFNVDAVLKVAEECYALNVGKLGFSCSNMLNKYKIIILMNYTTTWTCYGGGYDFTCSALWLNPATVKPAGHSLAHEVGHSFHYMCYAEATNYNRTSSQTDNTGFHLNCGNGQAIWEQTAQWQANQAYPELMFSQSYNIFRYTHNYAFSHEWHRYQSYWFHYFICQHYNDITTVAQVWKQPMKNQKQGDGSDFSMALMALKGLSVRDLYQLYFDYACRCVTWDLDACAPYRTPYVGNFEYRCVLTDDGGYQVALASCPQGTGFNVIPLQVPQAGTQITTQLTGLSVGAALLDADPGEYYNGDSRYVQAERRNYVNGGARAARGFRMGYVALMNDGTRRYFSEDSVYCQGTLAKTEAYSMTLPEGVSQLWLVVSPALKTYQMHKWDESIEKDDMWPYQVHFEGTDIGGSAMVYATPTLDGRDISDATFTYDVTFPCDAQYYSGTTVNISGQAAATLGTAFQVDNASIATKMQAWTEQGPGNNRIMFYAVNPNGSLASSGYTANDYGHWFNASGTVTEWGSGYLYSQFAPGSLAFSIGQYPGRLVEGRTYTISQALRYRKSGGKYAVARFVFRVTPGPATTVNLRSIDYTNPTTLGLSGTNVSPAQTTQSVYNLQGHRLAAPQRGINIVEGHKVVVK